MRFYGTKGNVNVVRRAPRLSGFGYKVFTVLDEDHIPITGPSGSSAYRAVRSLPNPGGALGYTLEIPFADNSKKYPFCSGYSLFALLDISGAKPEVFILDNGEPATAWSDDHLIFWFTMRPFIDTTKVDVSTLMIISMVLD
jgi:hypothetical protein